MGDGELLLEEVSFASGKERAELASVRLAHEGPIIDQLENKTATERANIKAAEIAKIGSIPPTSRKSYDIEVVSFEPIEGGVQVFARAWDANGQIGFGSDGTVDIERFIIINPPILVPDEDGSIERTTTDSRTGQTWTFTYREDPQEALLQSLEHTIEVKQQKFGSDNIVAERVGNTTTTIYPDADTESTSVDGYAAFDAYQNATWAQVHDATASASASDSMIWLWVYLYRQT
jgi:hypothetical protein